MPSSRPPPKGRNRPPEGEGLGYFDWFAHEMHALTDQLTAEADRFKRSLKQNEPKKPGS